MAVLAEQLLLIEDNLQQLYADELSRRALRGSFLTSATWSEATGSTRLTPLLMAAARK